MYLSFPLLEPPPPPPSLPTCLKYVIDWVNIILRPH
jgi:hypothetical protein